ncbi:SNRK [Cordylochernes scorpioides]|uniref:SNRK n=1 Tax=Cordylochernes scorpioides TaxID=51811 RepID=A0ABY6JVB9_9ARAC|nr:SNRK [Cordylochernes scorpioides]
MDDNIQDHGRPTSENRRAYDPRENVAKKDVWSLGVILYMMVCGHAPFQEANDSETLTMIMDCKYTIPSYVSPECKALIGRMLIRDPEKRATLEQIAEDSWLQGAGPGVADSMPLISREHLLEEDHAHIVNKMVNGNIASKDQILEELDKNEYNHITATYFLLAERKLRALRQEKAQQLNHRTSRPDLSPIAVTPGVSSAAPSPAQEKLFPMFSCPPRPAEAPGSLLLAPELPPALPLGRKCSIVREEEDSSPASSPSKSPVTLRPPAEMFAAAERTVLTLPVPTRTPGSSPKIKNLSHSGRRLHSVHSSPQLPLNEINEESNGHTLARTESSPTHTEQAPDGSFVNQNYLVDSTDSLDFLSDGQPRLVNSMSCGDLSVELPATTPPQPRKTPPPPPMVESKPKVSVSVSTGLSSLAHGTAAGLRSENNNLLVKLKLNKLVQNNLVASNTPVQINQNGWKKSSEPNSKRNSSHRGGNNHPSLELKLSSRCCSLC